MSMSIPADRMVVISSVVDKVKQQSVDLAKAAAQMKKKRPVSLLFINNEKILKAGRARANYERAVREAEAQIIKLLNKEALDGSDMEAKAEALAKAAFHKPGSVLTKEELSHIQEELDAYCREPIPTPDCTEAASSPFRTFDGTCNNIDNPLWGASFTPVGRLLPAQYEDGVQQPRGYFQARDKDLLHRDAFDPPNPSARQVVGKVHPDRPIDDPLHTHMMMQWGQFLDHDFALTPEFGEEDCPQPECEFTERCIPILVPSRDPAFDSSESSCLFFPRSVPVCDTVGTFTARNQLNVLTSYIDSSMVYGSSLEQANDLRAFEGGRLKVGPPAFSGAKDSLPLSKLPSNTSCPPQVPDQLCFQGGDPRPNEQVCTCVSMHACVHACVRACVHACVHVYVYVCMRACVRTCTCACVHTCMCTCMCACVRACMCACVCACVCVCVAFTSLSILSPGESGCHAHYLDEGAQSSGRWAFRGQPTME